MAVVSNSKKGNTTIKFNDSSYVGETAADFSARMGRLSDIAVRGALIKMMMEEKLAEGVTQ